MTIVIVLNVEHSTKQRLNYLYLMMRIMYGHLDKNRVKLFKKIKKTEGCTPGLCAHSQEVPLSATLASDAWALLRGQGFLL